MGIHGFAWVTVIFAYIEYRGLAKSPMIHGNPRKVIPEPAARIKPIEPLLGILFSVLFFVLFTFSINLIGVHRFDENLDRHSWCFKQAAFAKY